MATQKIYNSYEDVLIAFIAKELSVPDLIEGNFLLLTDFNELRSRFYPVLDIFLSDIDAVDIDARENTENSITQQQLYISASLALERIRNISGENKEINQNVIKGYLVLIEEFLNRRISTDNFIEGYRALYEMDFTYKPTPLLKELSSLYNLAIVKFHNPLSKDELLRKHSIQSVQIITEHLNIS